ncbi:MAG: aminoglycoside phosphotransferase family protein [Pelagibaca sp.]
MHDDHIPSDPDLVRALIVDQVPHLAHLPVTPVVSSGTDNAMYRLGDRLAVRLPRRIEAVPLIAKEQRILPGLSGLPLAVPLPRHFGAPSVRFPYPFTVVDWIEGAPADIAHLSDPVAAAQSLAAFLAALRDTDTQNGPMAGPANHNRGVPLSEMCAVTRRCIDALADEIDAPLAHEVWQAAREAPPHAGPPHWLHGDLKADNLLARDGRLVAVLDWGLAAVGDPAVDLAVLWTWLEGDSATAFRAVTDLPPAAWERARGWALYGAVIALEYYRDTADRPCRNAALCANSRRTLVQLGLRQAHRPNPATKASTSDTERRR